MGKPGPDWDTVPHSKQFLPRFAVSPTAANIPVQAAVHKLVETRNCSALKEFGVPRGCVCPCPAPPQVKNTSAKDENWPLLLLATGVLQPQEPEGARLGQRLLPVGRWSICPLEEQCWKGEQKQGGWRPASSLGSGQMYGIPESSGQTGHPHTNDTGIAGSDSAAWVMLGVTLR